MSQEFSRRDSDQIQFNIVIPARYASSRFPGKPLATIDGIPMVMRVHQRCVASGAGQVIIATDDNRIREVAESAGASVIMTRADHINGTDRIAEVAEKMNWTETDIVVNVQGDEPLIPVDSIKQVAENLARSGEATIATLATPIVDRLEFDDPTAVKVVFDKEGLALYFSRSPIPYDRDGQVDDAPLGYRHIGLYAYRAGFLRRYKDMRPCTIENREMLEQLRALFNGERIHVAEATELPGMGVDTPEQLAEVERLIQSGMQF